MQNLKRLILILSIGIFSHPDSLLMADNSARVYPKIMIHDSEKDFPLKLSKLNVNIKVVGNIAVTTYNMSFYNPENRVLEGELEFPLEEG